MENENKLTQEDIELLTPLVEYGAELYKRGLKTGWIVGVSSTLAGVVLAGAAITVKEVRARKAKKKESDV